MEHWHRFFRGAEYCAQPECSIPCRARLATRTCWSPWELFIRYCGHSGWESFEAAELTIILFNFLNYLAALFFEQGTPVQPDSVIAVGVLRI